MNDMNEVFESVAEKYAITAEEVKRTIIEAVRGGVGGDDILTRRLFGQLPQRDKELTAEEILTCLVVAVARERGI